MSNDFYTQQPEASSEGVAEPDENQALLFDDNHVPGQEVLFDTAPACRNPVVWNTSGYPCPWCGHPL